MKEKKKIRRPRVKSSRLGMAFKRFERRFLVSWVRFSHEHHESHVLPFVLFFLLFLDGFIMVIPSSLCLIVAITISPERWLLFGFLFASASFLNNSVTYFIGRLFPPDVIMGVTDFFHMSKLWDVAKDTLHDYGSWACLIGALTSLPTQLMTALIGLSDSERIPHDQFVSSTFIQAVILVFVGHGIKSLIIAGLTRYGWITMEKRFGREADRPD